MAGGGHKKRYLCAFHDAYVGIREEKKDLKLPTGREWRQWRHVVALAALAKAGGSSAK